MQISLNSASYTQKLIQWTYSQIHSQARKKSQSSGGPRKYQESVTFLCVLGSAFTFVVWEYFLFTNNTFHQLVKSIDVWVCAIKSELPYELQLLYNVSTLNVRNIFEFISQVSCPLCFSGSGISICEQPCAHRTMGKELNHAQQRTDRQNRGLDSYITIQSCVCVSVCVR